MTWRSSPIYTRARPSRREIHAPISISFSVSFRHAIYVRPPQLRHIASLSRSCIHSPINNNDKRKQSGAATYAGANNRRAGHTPELAAMWIIPFVEWARPRGWKKQRKRAFSEATKEHRRRDEHLRTDAFYERTCAVAPLPLQLAPWVMMMGRVHQLSAISVH